MRLMMFIFCCHLGQDLDQRKNLGLGEDLDQRENLGLGEDLI